MKRYGLDGARLEIGRPAEVGRDTGHFWFSTLHPVAGDAMLCLVVRADDKPQGEWPALMCLSRDGGASWERMGNAVSYGPNSVLWTPRTLLLLPYELWPLGPGDRRNAHADGAFITCGRDGSLRQERVEVKFLGFPHDLADYHEGEIQIVTNGNVLPLREGRLFMTMYGMVKGETRYTNYAVASEDGGLTWRFLSFVARPEGEADLEEGPDESNSVRLEDGRLLCIYRVGGMKEFRKSYSADEGSSWTAPQRIAGAWSVEPQLVRLDNGLILLSGGRPGLLLWVCADGRGERWQPVNLAEHHNALLADAALHYAEEFRTAKGCGDPPQSTSYTGMKQVGPNEALLSYDRLGNGWAGAPGPWGGHDAVFCVRVRADRA